MQTIAIENLKAKKGAQEHVLSEEMAALVKEVVKKAPSWIKGWSGMVGLCDHKERPSARETCTTALSWLDAT